MAFDPRSTAFNCPLCGSNNCKYVGIHRMNGSYFVIQTSGTTGKRPLEKTLWAAAFDSVGGEQLAWLTRTMQQNGLIASFGNAGGIELKTTVLPFILRGVRLIGLRLGSPRQPTIFLSGVSHVGSFRDAVGGE